MNDTNLPLVSVTVMLFLIMHPIGHVFMFLKMTQNIAPERRVYVILREMCIALAVMLFVYWVGIYILQFLNVSEAVVRISSGLILFLVAIKILFPPPTSYMDVFPVTEEPFIVPLAIPMVAGPSLVATIMLYRGIESLSPFLLPAIILAWLLSIIVLITSPKLSKILGTSGLSACEKLGGLILVLLATQRFMEGVQWFILNKCTKL